jgi:DHA1 family inner membrane transport protein
VDNASRVEPMRRVAVLSAGAFVVGVDGTLLIGLLDPVGSDFGVSVPIAGQAVTVFAVSYALFGPMLVRASRRVDTGALVAASLAVFCMANLACAAATSFGVFLVFRVTAGASAGVFMPTAALAASGSLPAERRGRALALVIGGSSLAAALGVPIGVALGTAFGWRIAFVALAVLGIAVALVLGMRWRKETTPPAPSQSTPAGHALRRAMPILLVTTVWSTGSFTFFTYLAPVLQRSAGIDGYGVSIYLSLFGLAGITGAWLAGRSTDQRGPVATALVALGLMSFALFSTAALTQAALPSPTASFATGVAITGYGLATWAVMPAQQYRLLTAAPGAERVLLALNASALYAGIAIGGALGGALLRHAHLAALPAAAALIELVAAGLLAATHTQTDDWRPAASDSRIRNM